MNEELKNRSKVISKDLFELSDFLYNNPELSGEEHKAKEALIRLLKKYNFKCYDVDYPELETAFVAKYDSNKPGLIIAYCAEYDALPSVGHGCGHNLIAAVGSGAGILLSKYVDLIGGQVWVMGTPAEETYGGKIPMIESGLFNDVDIAMMAHPYSENRVSGNSLAFHAIDIAFRGKAAHAAADPEKGINALSAMQLVFAGISYMREHLTGDVRVHGIITDGGAAPNIIPDYSRANIYVRAGKKAKANEIRERLYGIIKGAELMTGAKAEINSFEHSYDDMNTNGILSDICTESMNETGFKNISHNMDFNASIDMGNVSYVVPSIHPYFDITNNIEMNMHSKEFAKASSGNYAKKQMLNMAMALAMTGYKVLTDKEIYKKIKKEFDLSTRNFKEVKNDN